MKALNVRRTAAIVGFLLFAVVGATPSWADIDNDRYESDKPWYVGISGPANWRMNEQASYASTCIKTTSSSASDENRSQECQRSDLRYQYSSILLWMHRRSPGGKMLLAAEKLEQPMNSLEYANKTRELLGKLGFEARTPQLHAATGAYWLEFNNDKRFLRQAVLVSGQIGYSLTLSATTSRDRSSHLRAFDFALRSIRIDREKTSPGPDSPGDSDDPSDGAQTGDTTDDQTSNSGGDAGSSDRRSEGRGEDRP